MPSRPVRFGFTVVELLVVIAVIGVLVAIALPAVQSARESGRRTQCNNNLKQIGLALRMYHDSQQRYPAGSLEFAPPGTSVGLGWGWGWGYHLLPFLEQAAAFESLKPAGGVCCNEIRAAQNSTPPKKDPSSMPFSVFACPSDPLGLKKYLSGPTGPHPNSADCGWLFAGSYLGVAGDKESVPPTPPPLGSCNAPTAGIMNGNGMLFSNVQDRVSRKWVANLAIPVKLDDVLDGTSNTMMVGERGIPKDYGWGWTICGGTECEQYLSTQRGLQKRTASTPYDDGLLFYWSWHSNGAHFVFADGSVRFLTIGIDPTTYHSLSTRRSRDAILGTF